MLNASPIGQGFVLRTFDGPFVTYPEQLYVGTLGNTTGTLYTAPATNTVSNELSLPPRVKIREILACNLTGSAQTFTVYIVPSAGSASDANAIFKTFSVAANITTGFSLNTILPQGGTIQGLAGASSAITLAISGEVYLAP